jgi:hypothetical protein
MFDKCIIIGSGNSIQEGINKGLQKVISNEITFTINEEFRLFNSTCEIFGDWTFYKCRYDLLKHHPLIISGFSPEIGGIDKKSKKLICAKLPQLIFIQTCSTYLDRVNIWKKGFYSRKLTGLLALSLAINLDFKEIYLLGFDGCSINNKTHHYENMATYGMFVDDEDKPRTGVGLNKGGQYKTGCYNQDKSTFNDRLWSCYKKELERVKIYNVSLNSKIDIFPKMSYDMFLEQIKSCPNTINQDIVRQKIKEKIKNYAKFDQSLFTPIN